MLYFKILHYILIKMPPLTDFTLLTHRFHSIHSQISLYSLTDFTLFTHRFHSIHSQISLLY